MSQINSKLYVIRDVFQGMMTRAVDMQQGRLMTPRGVNTLTGKALPLQPVMKSEAPPVDLTALWLIPVSSPCPAPAVPKMSRHLTHPLSLSVSPHNDDSWLFTGCSTPIWKCPICSLYKWSWVELFWQVGRSSLTGMTCCFDAFKSNCMCCRLWPYFSPHIWVNRLNWCFLDQNQNTFETFFLAFAQSLSSKTPHRSANELNSGPWHSLKSQLQTTKNHIFSITPTGI